MDLTGVRTECLAGSADTKLVPEFDQYQHLTDPADAVGVSRGLLYHYFPTKQDFAPRAADLAGHERRVSGAFDVEEPSSMLRASIRGWLAFVIAVIVDWLADRGGMSREDLVELCTRTLVDVVGRYVPADD